MNPMMVKARPLAYNARPRRVVYKIEDYSDDRLQEWADGNFRWAAACCEDCESLGGTRTIRCDCGMQRHWADRWCNSCQRLVEAEARRELRRRGDATKSFGEWLLG